MLATSARWKPPNGVFGRYKITITDLDDDNNTFDTAILPGTQRRYMIDEYAGEPIIPDEDFIVNVEYVGKMPAPLLACGSRSTLTMVHIAGGASRVTLTHLTEDGRAHPATRTFALRRCRTPQHFCAAECHASTSARC